MENYWFILLGALGVVGLICFIVLRDVERAEERSKDNSATNAADDSILRYPNFPG